MKARLFWFQKKQEAEIEGKLLFVCFSSLISPYLF